MPEGFLPLVTAAAIAVAVTLLSTGGIRSPFAPEPDVSADVDASASSDTTAPARTASAETDAPSLRVHPLLPASLRPGGTRHLILQISGPVVDDLDEDDLLEVTFAVAEPRAGVWVRPKQGLLPRGSLQRTRFAIGLHPDVACDANLGSLQVTVRHIAEDGAAGEATVPLPPVDCAEAPPSSPESVHVTDPVCGEGWREELEAIKEGEELDPERCAEERWGEDPGSEPSPPPARTTRRASAPEEETPEPEEPPEEAPEEAAEETVEEAEAEEPAEEAEAPAEDGSAEEVPEEASSNEAPEGAAEEDVGEGETPEETPSEE